MDKEDTLLVLYEKVLITYGEMLKWHFTKVLVPKLSQSDTEIKSFLIKIQLCVQSKSYIYYNDSILVLSDSILVSI